MCHSLSFSMVCWNLSHQFSHEPILHPPPLSPCCPHSVSGLLNPGHSPVEGSGRIPPAGLRERTWDMATCVWLAGHWDWVRMASHTGNDTTEVKIQNKCLSLKLLKREKGRRYVLWEGICCQVAVGPWTSHFSELQAATTETRTQPGLANLMGWMW